MDLNGFVTRHFKARDNVCEQVEQLAATELRKIHGEGRANVVIADQGQSFLISVVGRTKNRFFSSESYHVKQEIWGWPRDWQVGAVYRVLTDFIRQVELHFVQEKLSKSKSEENFSTKS